MNSLSCPHGLVSSPVPTVHSNQESPKYSSDHATAPLHSKTFNGSHDPQDRGTQVPSESVPDLPDTPFHMQYSDALVHTPLSPSWPSEFCHTAASSHSSPILLLTSWPLFHLNGPAQVPTPLGLLSLPPAPRPSAPIPALPPDQLPGTFQSPKLDPVPSKEQHRCLSLPPVLSTACPFTSLFPCPRPQSCLNKASQPQQGGKTYLSLDGKSLGCLKYGQSE